MMAQHHFPETSKASGFATADKLLHRVNHAVDKEQNEEIKQKTNFQKYMDLVTENCLDFNSWVALLSIVESDTSIEISIARDTFERFLAEFPLCFGYWNKYAGFEKKQGLPDESGVTPNTDLNDVDLKTRSVYERGVVAVRHSADMWLNYINYIIDDTNTEPDECRSLLERALEVCSTDPASGPLWDKYISLETTQNDLKRVYSLYMRILKLPLHNLEAFWAKFNEFIVSHPLSSIISSADMAELIQDGDDTDEGALRSRLVNKIEVIKNATVVDSYQRAYYEKGIDRSYFHVKPLKEESLANWRAYLDFEEKNGNKVSIEKLHERCLIACANYAEFWNRYALWKEKMEGFVAAMSIFNRATSVFLKFRADIHLFYAAFLEANGRIDEARQVFQKILSTIAPNLVEGVIHFANFERRQGSIESTIKIYEDAMAVANASSLPHIAVHFARFQERVLRNIELARQTYKSSLHRFTNSKTLWLSFIHFEATHGGDDALTLVQTLFASAVGTNSQLSIQDKAAMWDQYEDFLEDFGASIHDVRSVQEGSAQWRLSHSLGKKRQIDDMSSQSSKQPRFDESYSTQQFGGYQYDSTAYQGYDHAAYAQYYVAANGSGASGGYGTTPSYDPSTQGAYAQQGYTYQQY